MSSKLNELFCSCLNTILYLHVVYVISEMLSTVCVCVLFTRVVHRCISGHPAIKFGTNQVIVMIFPMFNRGGGPSDTKHIGSSLKAKISQGKMCRSPQILCI